MTAVKAADIDNLDQARLEEDPSPDTDDLKKAKIFIEMYDSNKDGKLDADEILAGPMKTGIDELYDIASAKSWISSLDRDKDGELDVFEVSNFRQEADQKAQH